MPLFTAQLHPKRAVGFLVLGASLHDVLTRLKAEPQQFPELELAYSRDRPVHEPVNVNLPANGMRLRFDGPEQRLRLIEIVDFTKNHISFNDRDIVKPPNPAQAPGPRSSPIPGESSSGPSFRHIYHKLLGPTYAGEFIPSQDDPSTGMYVLSYPGVAFTFSLPASLYSPNKDVVTLLSSAPNQTATSMAVYNGSSWAQAREQLWTEILPSIKTNPALPRGKDVCPDEISLVRIYGGGKMLLFKKWTNASFLIQLGDTTPQELVAELGPPDAIYRKHDQRMTIHKQRNARNRGRADSADAGRPEDLTDTDQSSQYTGSEDTNDEDAPDGHTAGSISGECFYNYFYHGFDVLVTTPVPPSRIPPAEAEGEGPPGKPTKSWSPDRLVATKLVLHGNIPGSYEFNRHRRCRWDIGYLDDSCAGGGDLPNSETKFKEIQDCLSQKWNTVYPPHEVDKWQHGMVLNRGWGDSPGSSCEFLGGWEDQSSTLPAALPRRVDGSDDSTTTLFGLPGLVFEVLKNDYVNAVTVY